MRSAESKKHRVSYRINPRKNTPRHIVIKLTKRQRTLKATREKQQITLWEFSCKLSADFSAETLEARREWHEIFKVMKGKKLPPRILYPPRLLFRFDGEIKSFTDKQKIEFSTTRPALQQTLKELTTFLGRKENSTTRNKKITKWKHSLVKVNIP